MIITDHHQHGPPPPSQPGDGGQRKRISLSQPFDERRSRRSTCTGKPLQRTDALRTRSTACHAECSTGSSPKTTSRPTQGGRGGPAKKRRHSAAPQCHSRRTMRKRCTLLSGSGRAKTGSKRQGCKRRGSRPGGRALGVVTGRNIELAATVADQCTVLVVTRGGKTAEHAASSAGLAVQRQYFRPLQRMKKATDAPTSHLNTYWSCPVRVASQTEVIFTRDNS